VRWFPAAAALAALLVLVAGIAAVRWLGSTPAVIRETANTPATSSVSFTGRPIGEPGEGQVWITDLTIADVDGDGWKDVVVGDGRLHRVSWLRQLPAGSFTEQTIGAPVAGPAHIEVVDLDRDGDCDVLVASMGVVTPNDDRIGAVVVLENDGAQIFTNRVLLERTHRVTDVQAADLDGDGDLDLVVGQFGYFEGQVQWLENLGGWRFAGHRLLDLAGTVHAPVADLNLDGHADIVAHVTQDWEEVYAFDNVGGGQFRSRVLHGSTNKDYGGSGLTVADLDRDGDPDLIYTNGDGFDYATPAARPWHGVQWLENDGAGRFAFRRIGSLPGAYSPLVIDLDGDGDRDVMAVSGFNDWSRPDAVSLAWFENNGAQNFTRHVLAHEPTHLVVVDGADLDRDGSIELVTGSFGFYPPFERAGRVTLWKRTR